MVNFRLDAFLTCINELVRSDEMERALWLCDNLPAYYRDHKPKEVVELKDEILKRLSSPTKAAHDMVHFTMVSENDLGGADNTLRSYLIKKEVEIFNKYGQTPHIVDLGPGNYFVPIMLKKAGLKFTYFPVCIALHSMKEAEKHFKDEFVGGIVEDRPRIFIACEIIEHLWREEEIKTNMLHYCGWPDIIHISTPKYTYGFLLEDWKSYCQELGHLRAYTPQEFQDTATRIIGEKYFPQYFDHYVMHLRMLNKESKFELEDQLDLSEFVNQLKEK